MKGKSKYIVPLLLAGVTASAGVVTTINQQQQTMIQAQTENTEITNINGAEIKMTRGFEDIYQLGDEITMPVVDVVENEGLASDSPERYDIVYRIFRGSKEVATITDATKKFVPSYTGAYNVVIEATKDNTVVSKLTGLTIMVEKADAVINLPVNSEYVIPAQLPVSNELGLTIPAPTVTVTENGEDVEKTADEADLIVKLITPNAEEPTILTLDQSGKFYKVSKAKLATAGTYQIRYEYRDSNDVLISKLETNFQVVNNLEVPTNLYLKLSGSVPATGNVNKEISIPKVTVLDSKNSTDGINAHVTIKVTKVGENGTSQEINYKDYTFTPTEEGVYYVTYQADLNSIYAGVTSTLYQHTTTIKVTDKANPTVMPTYSYTVVDGVITGADKNNDGTLDEIFDEDDETAPKIEDVLVNRKADVPSIAVRGSDGKARFRLPAIYGTDNKTGYSNMTFSREIVGNNIAKKTVQAKANELSEEIELSQTGNYEIRYIATDEAGNKVRATYNLVVKDADDVENGKTTVNMNINVTSVSNKDVLRFSVPTATDTYDSNLDVVVAYDIIGTEGSIAEGIVLSETNANGKYEIKIADIIKEYGQNTNKPAKLVVYTTATADSTLAGTREAFRNSGNTITKVSKEITIVDTTSDETSAVLTMNGTDVDASNWNAELLKLNAENLIEKITVDNSGSSPVYSGYIGTDGYAYNNDHSKINSDGGKQLAAFDQGNGSITLPEITFTDSDENLRLTLTIEDRFGNAVTKNTYEVIEKVQSGNVWKYTVGSASFKLSASGVYTVTYRAEDTAGNVTVKSFGIRVNDKTAPTIVIDDEDKFGVDVEVGEFFEVPVGTLYKDGQPEEDGSVTWQLTCSAGAIAETSSTGFTPLTEGTYYITYYGVDEFDNEQILQDNTLFYVNAVDTTDPVFNDDSSFVLNPTLAWTPENDEMEVKIPVVYATDPIKNESLDVVYSVTSPDGSKITIKDFEDEDLSDVRYFVATKQGVYTVTYTATDSANNTVTMTKEIAIGDCEAPEISWKNDDDIPTSMTLGDTWTLPLSNMTLTDKVTTDQKFLNDKMKISLIKPDGTTSVVNEGTTGKNYIWTFSDTGAYTLRIVVEDEAGQSRTYKYTINVASDDAESDVVNSVVGTVLIVVSVVILAGVVIYFVLSSRKKTPAKKSPKSKKND